MKGISTYISEKLKISSNLKIDYNYYPKTRKELQDILKKLLDERGPDADLNDIDVSNITDTSWLFNSDFCGDISEWNVSNVKNMNCMFHGCKSFNSDLSQWDVSHCENMSGMFAYCRMFNSNISNWNVSNVRDMSFMFCGCLNFKQDLNKWDVSNVRDGGGMFMGCKRLGKAGIPKWYTK